MGGTPIHPLGIGAAFLDVSAASGGSAIFLLLAVPCTVQTGNLEFLLQHQVSQSAWVVLVAANTLAPLSVMAALVASVSSREFMTGVTPCSGMITDGALHNQQDCR